eukprot:380594-Pelagomonas_calceolata.AAC.11
MHINVAKTVPDDGDATLKACYHGNMHKHMARSHVQTSTPCCARAMQAMHAACIPHRLAHPLQTHPQFGSCLRWHSLAHAPAPALSMQ